MWKTFLAMGKMKILKMLKQLRPRDIIAIVIIVCGSVVRGFGGDGIVGSIMIAVTGAYFGYEVIDRKVLGPDTKKGKKNRWKIL